MASAVRRGGSWFWCALVGALGCNGVVDTDGPEPSGDAMVDSPDDASVQDAGRDASQVRDASPARDAASVDAGGRDAGADAATADAGTQEASWLIASGDSVFFVGNSFFSYQDRYLDEWVAAIGQAVPEKIEIKTGRHNVPGVQPLSWFFEQDESKNAIASGQYDMFVLQGEDEEPVMDKEGFHAAVRAYHAAITAKGGKVMLFMTWDWWWENQDKPDSQFLKDLSASYDEIGKELNIPVIPVGLIYNDTNKDPFPGQQTFFLTGHDLHQVASGSAVNAYATFSMLTGIDAMGIRFDARNNDNSDAMLAYCSDKSWARVMERLQP